jgi:sugar phosphate permease
MSKILNNKVPYTGSGITEKIDKVKRLAWIMWSVAMIAQLFNMFHRIAVPAAIDRIMADMKITGSVAGNIMAMYFYIYAIMQFPSGVLADFLGARKTITFGCFVAGLGSLLFGLAPSISLIYAGRFLVGLGVSVIFVNVFKIAIEWFEDKRFALMASLQTIISTAGALVATTPLAFLVNLTGWRISFEIVGIVSLVIALTCWLVIRNNPADKGLPRPQDWTKISSSESAPRPPEDAGPQFRKSLRILFNNKLIWPPFLLGMGFYGTLLAFQGAWGIPFLMQVYSLSRPAAANFIFIILFSQIPGLALFPYISGKIHRRKPLAIIGAIGYTLPWLLLIFWNGGKPPEAALYPICVAMGFFNGFMPLLYTCTREIVSREVSGMALGVVNMSSFLSAAVFQILMGVILDLKWEGVLIRGARVFSQSAFQLGFMVVGVGVLTSIVGAFLLKETHCQNISGN